VVEKRLPNDLAVTLKTLEPHRADITGIAVESTFNWYWIVGVSSQGHVFKSVKVRPRLKDSDLVAWEAPWRESKTVEPSDNRL
jgi:hypothetical protein